MNDNPPDAFLALATGCPHCPVVLQALGELVKGGEIGRLTVVNLGRHPEEAERLGIRQVPWIRIGPFELQGLHRLAELRQWVERTGSVDGMAEYLRDRLRAGDLATATRLVKTTPQAMDALLALLTETDSELPLRLGVDAIFDELAGTPILAEAVDRLAALAREAARPVRIDAIHYLGLAGTPAARDRLKALARDPDPEIQATAREVLAETTS